MILKPTYRMLALAACLAAFAGCGGDEEGQSIPQDQAAALQEQLESIRGRFEQGGGACRDIVEGDDTNVRAVENALEGLPADTDADVREALRESFDHLFRLVEAECPATEPQETTPEELPQTETEPPPQTETETTPTETEEEERPEPPGQQKKNKRNGKDGGNNDGGDGGTAAPGGGE